MVHHPMIEPILLLHAHTIVVNCLSDPPTSPQICNCPLAARSSRLFRSFPKDLLQSLAEENITGNFHSWSLSLRVSFCFHSFYVPIITSCIGWNLLALLFVWEYKYASINVCLLETPSQTLSLHYSYLRLNPPICLAPSNECNNSNAFVERPHPIIECYQSEWVEASSFK